VLVDGGKSLKKKLWEAKLARRIRNPKDGGG
jgi:hypothetical protein